LSKLFDQLKKAARSRRDRSPGLLLEALQKAQDRRDGPVAPEPVVTPAETSAPAAFPASRSSYSGFLLALAIFLVVLAAWYSSPWRAPQKIKIDPTDLKLDRSLDLQRQPSRGTSSPARPS